jgi:hypothetical protein
MFLFVTTNVRFGNGLTAWHMSTMYMSYHINVLNSRVFLRICPIRVLEYLLLKAFLLFSVLCRIILWIVIQVGHNSFIKICPYPLFMIHYFIPPLVCMHKQVESMKLCIPIDFWIPDRQSVGQFVLVSGPHLKPMTSFFLSENFWFLDVGRSLWGEDGPVTYFWAMPE